MFRGQRDELLGSAAPSSSSLKSKIYLFQTKMSSNVKGPSSAGDYGSVCETFRCHPPTNLRLSRTVKRILAACLVSLVTLLGSVSIDLNNCLKDWRSTEEALYGLSSCTNLLAMKFISFLQDQKKLCCWDNLNFTDRRTFVMDNMRSFCREEGGLQNYNRICENKAEMRHICELFTRRLKMRLDDATDTDPTLGDVFSGMITQILEEWNSSDGDLMTSMKNQDWMDVLSLRLLLRAREAMGDLGCPSPVASEDLQSASYRILTMLNYAVYTSDTLHACWMDNGNGSSLSGYLTKYRNVLLFAPLGDPRSTFGNLTADGRLDSARNCLFHKAYEKLNDKSKDILGEVSLKVTLLAVTCVLYPIVLVSFKQMTEWIQDYAKSLKERTEDLKKERRVAEDLLHQMLPRTVAKQLRKQKQVEAESYDQVTIFFSDIVGFTAISASCTPLQVVGMLNSLYVCFDSRIESYNVYKVETIGDAYMVVSGLPERNNTRHADEIAKMSLDLVAAVRQVVIPHLPDERLRLRAGIHTGPCVAGVVGYKMPRYCLFGDTVNTASRMESTSLPQKIHISSATYQILLIDDAYEIELRGEIEVKGKGKMKTYWLLGNKNYSVQNDSLVCHWNPEISRKKKLELSLGSVQQSFSSIIPSETSRVNTPRTVAELSGEESMEQSQELRVEDCASDTTTEPKTPQSPTQQDRPSSLRVPVSARAEGDVYNKLGQKAIALPGFVEES